MDAALAGASTLFDSLIEVAKQSQFNIVSSSAFRKIMDTSLFRYYIVIYYKLLGRRPLPGRQDSWSTMPAVIVDLGIGCPYSVCPSVRLLNGV